MGYFVAYADRYVDVDSLRQNAPTIGGAETVVFTERGSFFWRVDNPLIGEQFAFLSDVSVVGASEGIIQDVTYIGSLTLHQVIQLSDGTKSLVTISSGSAEIDQVLGRLYPNHTNNSLFQKLIVEPANPGATYLPEFYLEADGDVGFFDQVYGPLGFDAPNDGRALITRGAISGQRDLAWGNWLDIVTRDGDVVVTPGEYNDLDPGDPDFVPPDALLPLPLPEDPYARVSGHIDYTADSSGTVYFTEQQYEAFRDVSAEFSTNLISGMQSWVIKKAATAALTAAFPGAGWVGALKTTWDVYSATQPLVHVGLQSYLYQIGLATTQPTNAEIERAFFVSAGNVALKLKSSSAETLGGSVAEVFKKAGIKTFGSILFSETNSFTYTLFEERPEAAAGITATGGEKSDIALGSLFADNIRSNGGNDRLFGFDGWDTLHGGSGKDNLSGGAGSDNLNGGPGADTMYGGAGNDSYFVDHLGDRVSESSSSNRTVDAGGIDGVSSWVSFSLRRDVGVSFVENLTLIGGSATTATGNDLPNRLKGNQADNRLLGDRGDDTLIGGRGNDLLRGGAGDDLLNGGSRNDRLEGGPGSDRLTGGTGSDVFVLTTASGSDTITDFSRSQSDRIVVDQSSLRIGDGDARIEGATRVAGPGGFSSRAELVIVTGDAPTLDATGAASAIGRAIDAYTVGRKAIFVIDNGVSSQLYRFTSADSNAVVSANELKLLATLTGVTSMAVGDFLFAG